VISTRGNSTGEGYRRDAMPASPHSYEFGSLGHKSIAEQRQHANVRGKTPKMRKGLSKRKKEATKGRVRPNRSFMATAQVCLRAHFDMPNERAGE